MKVFKFGGASVNSAEAVRNMTQIVKHHLGQEPLVVVVSAMGKTTNLLEHLLLSHDPLHDNLRAQLEQTHRQIAHQLLPNSQTLQQQITQWLTELDNTFAKLNPEPDCYNYNYDQIVAFGELLSTTIINTFLQTEGIDSQWIDARRILRTDGHHREGHINWLATETAAHRMLNTEQHRSVILTQGFIASDLTTGATTTLGREGSDYSAAILAYCLGAESVTIWKDVPGFLNADPKYFANTVKIHQIPYNEAIELAYYGASVIHPKTVKPIQNRGIPLFIKSFITPDTDGSVVGDFATIQPLTPLYIFKNNQILLSISPRDFSFIAEDNLQIIFGILNQQAIKVNLMQNTALSFSICLDHQPHRVEQLIARLNELFYVKYNENLQLITIRYYTPEVIESILAGRTTLLEQRSRTTAQLVVPSKE